MSIYLIHLINGLAFGFLLAIIASGLALIFGFMRIVNFAHGAFYMLGAYLTYSIVKISDSFWIALIFAPLIIAFLGYLFHKFILTKLSSQEELTFVLVTYGFALIIENFVRMTWGTASYSIDPPLSLSGTFQMFDFAYPLYRIFLILFVLSICLILYWILYYTRWGLQVRAETEDSEMAMALGIRSKLLSIVVFIVGILLAGMAGVLVGPYLSLHHGMGADILTYAFVVVVIAGMRSFFGTMISGLFVGIVLTIGNIFFPSLSVALVYFIMIMVLIVRPTGLFVFKNS